MTIEPMVFDEPIIEIAVSIQGKDYVLREASGDAVVRYRNKMAASAVEIGPTGRPKRIQGLADTEPLLVSLCIFTRTEQGELRAVPESVVRSWPNRVQTALYNKIKEISDISEGEPGAEERLEEEAKNESSGSEDG